MATPKQNIETASTAINSALQAGIIVRCPLHPTELIAVGDDENSRVNDRAKEQIHELLKELPTSCPRCADADD